MLSRVHPVVILSCLLGFSSAQNITWYYPTSGKLFGVTINWVDVIQANWDSDASNPALYVWGPNATSAASWPKQWLNTDVYSTGTYNFSFSSNNIGYSGGFPFPAHFEIVTGINDQGYVEGVDSDVFTVTSTAGAPTTYLFGTTIKAASTAATDAPSISLGTTFPSNSANAAADSPSPTPSQAVAGGSGSSISGGAIAGIVIAAIVILAAAIGAAYWLLRRSKKRKDLAKMDGEKANGTNGINSTNTASAANGTNNATNVASATNGPYEALRPFPKAELPVGAQNNDSSAYATNQDWKRQYDSYAYHQGQPPAELAAQSPYSQPAEMPAESLLSPRELPGRTRSDRIL